MNNERLKTSIEECLTVDYQLNDGTMIKGLAESSLPFALRAKGWQRVPLHRHFEFTLSQLGFVLVYAKAGKVTRNGGFKYYVPCRAWVKPTAENSELINKFRA